MNYAELVLRVKSYLENDFPGFVSNLTGEVYNSKQQLDAFIPQAEEKIYGAVQSLVVRRNVMGNTMAGDKYLALPNDFLAAFSVAIVMPNKEHHFLLNKDVSFIRESYPSETTVGVPDHYALFDHNTILLGPSPDQNYPVEMHYYRYPTSIVEAGTTWLGDNFENVLTYGTIVEAYTHMKGEKDLIEEYKGKYMEAMGLLKLMQEGRARTDVYRGGQARIPTR